MQKRKRREYRQIRRAQFTRPDPGFSLYEGRTRGKRMRYTYDDEDDNAFLSDATSARRSGRFSERDTPVDAGPVTTLSGRQVKPRRGGEYGASLLSGQNTNYGTPDYDENDGTDSDAILPAGRASRAARVPADSLKRKYVDDYNDDMSEEEDDVPSGEEWNSEANEQDDYDMPDADDGDEEIDDDELDDLGNGEPKSLVVKLRVSRAQSNGDQHHKVVNGQHEPKVDVSNGAVTSDAKHEVKQDENIRPHFDTPTQLNPPLAQVPLSEYPTPASLPAAVLKAEFSAPTEAQSVWQQPEEHHPAPTPAPAPFVPQPQ